MLRCTMLGCTLLECIGIHLAPCCNVPCQKHPYQSLTMLGCHMQFEGLMHPLSRVEMPLVRVLASMEHTRMAINVHILEKQK